MNGSAGLLPEVRWEADIGNGGDPQSRARGSKDTAEAVTRVINTYYRIAVTFKLQAQYDNRWKTARVIQ